MIYGKCWRYRLGGSSMPLKINVAKLSSNSNNINVACDTKWSYLDKSLFFVVLSRFIHLRFFKVRMVVNHFNDPDFLDVSKKSHSFLDALWFFPLMQCSLFDIGVESPIIPIWISFLNLRPHLFSLRILHAQGSLFGHSLKVDNATSFGSRLSVVHVLVELDIAKKKFDRVWLGLEKFVYIQHVEIEYFPLCCVHYKCIGHLRGDCRHKSSIPVNSTVNAINNVTSDGNATGVMKTFDNIATPILISALSVNELEVNGDICGETTNDVDEVNVVADKSLCHLELMDNIIGLGVDVARELDKCLDAQDVPLNFDVSLPSTAIPQMIGSYKLQTSPFGEIEPLVISDLGWHGVHMVANSVCTFSLV
ncbi:hypothetical protein IEQ34_022258 [Dendrobium chrysotoxum]|uniref:DUF4283 domain-containing protein n=1 Tax=Dendrobium chrysotoxum TaxID=161865 RepID=A0AAV7FYJ5_DENCH|nr:hypothetical protein IEQ34_022258 [Dendrobium chrysotoxum]